MKALAISTLLALSLVMPPVQAQRPTIEAQIGARSVSRYANCEINEEAALNTARMTAIQLIAKQVGNNWDYFHNHGSFYTSILVFPTGPMTPANRDWPRNADRAANPEKFGWLQSELGARWNHLAQYMQVAYGRGIDYRSMFIALCEPSIAEAPRITFSHPTANQPIALRWVNVAPIQGGGFLYVPVEER